MEDMSVSTPSPAPPAHPASTETAPHDLREWIARVEAIGQVTRVAPEVDWNEEMGAITYMAHQTLGAPALFFERIKGCPPGFRAL